MVSRGTPPVVHSLLVAEDDRAVRESLVRALELEGYSVKAVGNGAEAIDAATTSAPDVIVLDVSMPIVDGLTVCKPPRAQLLPAEHLARRIRRR